jgi:hypothetical protein
MPEIKKVFLRGKMNKDLDERLIPDGEYRDASNIQVSSSEGGDEGSNAGSVQNILGNHKLSDIKTLAGLNYPKCIATAKDTENNKIYWFIKDTQKQIIFEYSIDSANTNTLNNNLNAVVVDTSGAILNFPSTTITAVKVLDGLLIWSDNQSEPKMIDINVFKTATNNTYTQTTQIEGNPITEDDIVLIKKKPHSAPVVNITKYTSSITDSIFREKFIRFAYRWKFTNGQYSAFSPFTEVVFDPIIGSGFDYNTQDGFNERMINNVKKIKLTLPTIEVDHVEEIDILYKESNNTNVYVYKTVAATTTSLTIDGSNSNFLKESIYSVVPENQLIRQYDNVPYRAKALDIVGNRLVFGNYTDGLNVSGYTPNFTIGLVNRAKIADADSGTINETDKRSIKSGRKYQIGVVFEDEYGRPSPVVTSDSGIYTRDFNGLGDSTASPATYGKALTVRLDNVPSDSRIKKYKFFIKETAQEYYNFIVDSAYNDKESSEHIWIVVPSYEVNKVDKGDTIVFKKGKNGGVLNNAAYKYKVLESVNNKPDNLDSSETFDSKFFIKVKSAPELISDLLQQQSTAGSPSSSGSKQIDRVDYIESPDGAVPGGYYLGKKYLPYGEGSGGNWNHDVEFYYFKNGNIYVYEDKESNTSEFPPDGFQNTNKWDAASSNQSFCSTTLSGLWQTTNSSNFTDFVDSTGTVNGFAAKDGTAINSFYICYDASTIQTPSASPGSGPGIFEVIPKDDILDLYYETEESYEIGSSYTASTKTLKWYNTFDFGDGVESNRIKDDFNEVFIDKQVRVSTVINSSFKQKTNKSGLIYSGIYNSKNGVNELNQFNVGEKITKEINNEYGSIQKLHTRDTDLIVLCEDKILKVLANKDALYNADGNINLVSSNNVLGQAIAYKGEYGISKNPESFASYGYRAYFTDKSRGSVLRLTQDGLTVISERGMRSFFRNKLRNESKIFGSYDNYSNQYILTFNKESYSFKEDVKGWVSRLTYIATDNTFDRTDEDIVNSFENGLSIDNNYYTFKNGDSFLHHYEDAGRNLFYGEYYSSGIQFIFNQEASTIKNFKTLSYEGSEAKNGSIRGWAADIILTDQQEGNVLKFIEKEGKWFANVSGTTKVKNTLDSEEFSVQGLGNITSHTQIPVFTTTTTTASPTTTTTVLSAQITGVTTAVINTNITLVGEDINFVGGSWAWTGGAANGLSSKTVTFTETSAGSVTYGVTIDGTHTDTHTVIWTAPTTTTTAAPTTTTTAAPTTTTTTAAATTTTTVVSPAINVTGPAGEFANSPIALQASLTNFSGTLNYQWKRGVADTNGNYTLQNATGTGSSGTVNTNTTSIVYFNPTETAAGGYYYNMVITFNSVNYDDPNDHFVDIDIRPSYTFWNSATSSSGACGRTSSTNTFYTDTLTGIGAARQLYTNSNGTNPNGWQLPGDSYVAADQNENNNQAASYVWARLDNTGATILTNGAGQKEGESGYDANTQATAHWHACAVSTTTTTTTTATPAQLVQAQSCTDSSATQRKLKLTRADGNGVTGYTVGQVLTLTGGNATLGITAPSWFTSSCWQITNASVNTFDTTVTVGNNLIPHQNCSACTGITTTTTTTSAPPTTTTTTIPPLDSVNVTGTGYSFTYDEVVLTASALDANLNPYQGSKSYQWYKSSTNGFTPSSSNEISGATGSTYTAEETTFTGLMYYKCVVNNVTSNQYSISWSNRPQLTLKFVVSGAASSSACTGSDVTVYANGTNMCMPGFVLYTNIQGSEASSLQAGTYSDGTNYRYFNSTSNGAAPTGSCISCTPATTTTTTAPNEQTVAVKKCGTNTTRYFRIIGSSGYQNNQVIYVNGTSPSGGYLPEGTGCYTITNSAQVGYNYSVTINAQPYSDCSSCNAANTTTTTTVAPTTTTTTELISQPRIYDVGICGTTGNLVQARYTSLYAINNGTSFRHNNQCYQTRQLNTSTTSYTIDLDTIGVLYNNCSLCNAAFTTTTTTTTTSAPSSCFAVSGIVSTTSSASNLCDLTSTRDVYMDASTLASATAFYTNSSCTTLISGTRYYAEEGSNSYYIWNNGYKNGPYQLNCL